MTYRDDDSWTNPEWWPYSERNRYVPVPKEEEKAMPEVEEKKVFFEVKPVKLQLDCYELGDTVSALHDELGDTLEVTLLYKDGEAHIQLSPTQVHKILENKLEKLLPGLLEL